MVSGETAQRFSLGRRSFATPIFMLSPPVHESGVTPVDRYPG
jgi:hypothetical protein